MEHFRNTNIKMLPFLHFFIKAESKIHFQDVKLTRLKFKQKRIQEYVECEITTQIVNGKQGIDVFCSLLPGPEPYILEFDRQTGVSIPQNIQVKDKVITRSTDIHHASMDSDKFQVLQWVSMTYFLMSVGLKIQRSPVQILIRTKK